MVKVTNSSNQSQEGVAYNNGSGVWTGIDGGTAGHLMTSNGTNAAPSFQAVPSSSITLNGDSGSGSGNSFTFHAYGSSNDAGATVTFTFSGSTMTLNVNDLTDNIFLGGGCGLVNKGAFNTIIGVQSAEAINGAEFNNGVGVSGIQTLNGGAGNNYVGSFGFGSLVSGNYNVGLGDSVGDNYTGSESSNILLNSYGVLGESNVFRVGAGTGTGDQQLSTSYISGIAGATISAGSPTPHLILCDTSDDQLVCPTPVSAVSASSTFGSLAVGTPLQNTAHYPILVNVCLNVTAATGATVSVGVDSTNTPVAQAVTGSFSSTGIFSFSFVVPAGFYAEVTTSGTITISSITTLVTQIG